jgi:gliding motility-associated-like protein
MNKILFLIVFIGLAGINTLAAQEVLMRNDEVTACQPQIFTDSGGADSNYQDNENLTLTICPEDPGSFIILNFTVFATQPLEDVLTIFDGEDTSAPFIGQFSGVVSPGVVIATSDSGCLTINFQSTLADTSVGWEAEIFCTTTLECQTIEPFIASSNPPIIDGEIASEEGQEIFFEGGATFSIGDLSPEYFWDFGDGATAQGQSVSHAYTVTGTYMVTLTVTDSNPIGCSASTTTSVAVDEKIVTINDPSFPQSFYTPEQIIEDILVSGGCSEVTNFSYQFAGTVADPTSRSYGYFTNGSANEFPFQEGIVLSTGRASPAGNSRFTGNISFQTGIGGDDDLEDALGMVSGSNDATFIKFNFRSATNQISFRYIMASEEYDGNFECNFSDGFAFLLREEGTTEYENLAVLPNGDQVTVTNINDSQNCAANTEFFEGYNVGQTNYNGRTKVLVASADVVPNTTYEIKIVLADIGDDQFDSAIFLEAGSFNLGGDLGPDLTIDNGNAPCGGDIVRLDTRAESAVHVWTKDGVVIPGVTGSVLEVTEPGDYGVSAEFDDTCEISDNIIIEFEEAPEIQEPPRDLSQCGPNNTAIFNLLPNADRILGTQDPNLVNVTFHTTQLAANNGSSAITQPNVYEGSDGEVIWARVTLDGSQCYLVADFALRIFTTIDPVSTTFSLCDNNLDGDDTNGIAVFDLPLIDNAVLGGLDGSDFSVSYYRTQSDADARTNPITSPYPNTIPNSDQVVARVENNGNTDCYGTAVVDLVVEALPQISDQVELLQCDDDTDGFSVFNLEESEGLISSNFQNELFTYHESAADAEAGVNAIANPLSYTNEVAVSDRLYVRVSTGFGCHRLAELDLVVSSTQIPDDFELVYEICDGYEQDNDNTNGIASFDFSDATVQIESLFASGDVTVTYYQSIGEALEERNAITDISSYRNEASPFEQVLVVRVDSDVNNACVGLGEHIVLRTVNPQPNLDPDDIVQCDNNNPGDMSELFDLTQNEAYILGGEANVVASYHTSVEDAESGSNAISTPAAYANTSAFETIYVRVTNSITGCYARVEFDIEVDPLPEAIEVTDFVVCEDNTDGVFDFDLQSKTAEILNGQDPSIYQVSYHQSQADADNLNGALISPYTNISNPQTIYVSILNTQSGCSVSVQSFDLVIQEAAEANPDGIPIVYEICDNVNDNDGLGQFDLATQSAAILDGQDVNDFSVSYHASMEDAMSDQTPLPLLYENLSNPQVIYARVSNVVSPQECFSVAPLTLQVNLLPEIGIRDRYVLCAVTNGSEAVETPPVIDTGLSGTQYRFEWSYNGEVLPNETAPSIIATQSGEYGVFVTDIGSSTVTSCTGSASTVVIDSEPPQISAEVVSVAFSDRHDIEAMATGIGEYEYSLDNGPWQMDGLFEGVSLGVHVIRARDRNGCGTNSVEVVVMGYPKYFTPNGDGNNDLWQISGIENQPNAKIYIFDRYGKLLVQLSPTGRGWDGTYQGNLMPSDDYWFSVDYTEPTTGDPKVFKAHFTLKR